MIKYDVELKQLNIHTGNELSNNFYRSCVFCDKFVRINPANFNACSNIGDNKYCPSCLRHNFHHRDNHNILVFSFRGIIGYYYHRHYKCKPHKMWVSQIESMIETHQEIGLVNPVLVYDPDTFLWFANFNKIGKDSCKAPFEEVRASIKEMFDVFRVENNISPYASTTLWDRFEKATKLFYEQRKRPKDRKMLIPTMTQISNPAESDEFYEQTRTFIKTNLIVK